MANYTKATNFTAKDGLPTGNSGKIVKGTEIDTEFTAIASAIASKGDINSPTFTGTPAAPTASAGTNTTQLASTAFVKAAVDAFEAAMGATVIQTVTGSFTTFTAVTSSTPTATSDSLTITPTSASSKILILYTGAYASSYGDGTPSGNARLSMYRGTTNLAGGTTAMIDIYGENGGLYGTAAVNYLDSPATTSATTYRPYIWVVNPPAETYGALFGSRTMILMEIL
jgi:hypothetical protein